MSDSLPGVIRRTERALVEAERARNALGRVGSTQHRALMVSLEAVVAALEVELSRLRYAASHPGVAA